MAQTPTSVEVKSRPISSELTTQKKLATELMIAIDYQKSIQQAVDSGPLIFQRSLQKKSAEFKKENEKKYAQALIQYEQLKTNLAKDLQQKFINLLVQRYSAAELQYLIDLSKNTLYRRFDNFMKSTEVSDLQTEPFNKITELLDDKIKVRPSETKVNSK